MAERKKPLVILTGPTAIGKTGLSLKLADRIGGSILSADSMQVYRGLNIGSAKIKAEEMQGIPHYLIDVLDPSVPFNVASFKEMAKEAASDIWDRGRIPIVTGGTGFYIQAFLYDIDFSIGEEDEDYREEIARRLKEGEADDLYQELVRVDPESARNIHPHNLKRIIRALEFYRASGKTISEHNRNEMKKESPYNFCYFVLEEDRTSLYRKINERVDRMMEEGLLDEVKKLKALDLSPDLTAMQGIGYRELFDFLDGRGTLSEAVEEIKKNTRHYAKRQLTWFRRERDVICINKDSYGHDENAMLETILIHLREKGIWTAF